MAPRLDRVFALDHQNLRGFGGASDVLISDLRKEYISRAPSPVCSERICVLNDFHAVLRSMPALDFANSAVGAAHHQSVCFDMAIIANDAVDEAAFGHAGGAEHSFARS